MDMHFALLVSKVKMFSASGLSSSSRNCVLQGCSIIILYWKLQLDVKKQNERQGYVFYNLLVSYLVL